MRATSEARGSSVLKSMPPEEVQVKRSRGELSCAECRRCRIRCDRKVPCGSCVRRGCVSLCPNGSLRAGHGSRFVLADTEELHSRIAQMSQRIRQLEDALAVAHDSGDLQNRHPLLREDLLALKFGSDLHQVKEELDDEVSLSFGTLALTDSGGSKYFGVSAGALAALLAEEELISTPDAGPLNACLRQELSSLLCVSDDVKQTAEDRLHALRSCLPSRARALALCELYLEKCYFQPVERDDLLEDILVSVYDGNSMALRPHKAAVLFMVLAVGALADPSLSPCSPEAETYCVMGLRALNLRCVSTSPDIESVMALSLVAAYHGDSSKGRALEAAWSTMALTIKLAQKIGLHREPSKWNLEPALAQKRRRLFWNLMFEDGSRSLALGRPPTMSLSWIDCQIPDSSDSVEDILSTYKYHLTKDIFWPMLDILQSTSHTSYNSILDLDRKIRDLSLSANLPSEQECTSPPEDMHWFLSTHARYIVLLCIHRPFLALALTQNPENPLDSSYAPSVLATQTSASAIIRSTARQLEKDPVTYMRIWSVWIYLFSAAVAAGSIVSRAPTMPSSALSDLDVALNLFEKGANQSRHAKVILPFVRQLRDKARSACAKPQARNQSRHLSSDENESDFCLYPGNAQVLSRKNMDKWSSRSMSHQDLRDSQSPPQTPPFLPYAQSGYHSPFAEHYANPQSGTGMQGVSLDQHLHHPVRNASFDFSPSNSFSQSSTPIPQGLGMSADLFGDGALYPGDGNQVHPSISGHWLSFMQDNGVDFIHT